MRRTFAAVALVLAVSLSGCSAEPWGIPGEPLEVTSPDGRFTAFVRNHPDIDPFNQSLWVKPSAGNPVRVARIPGDAWWCDDIVWSADGGRVAFVVADAVLFVYDVKTGTQVFSGFAGRRSWETPPRFVLRDVALSSDGTAVSFRECDRSWSSVEPARQNRSGTRVESSMDGCTEAPIQVVLADVPRNRLWH